MNACGSLTLVLGALALGFSPRAPAASAPDPLWEKALAVARTNQDAVAGLVITRSEVVFKGATNGVHELWERAIPGPRGEVVTQTVKVLEDGKDITAKEVKKQNKQSKQANAGARPPASQGSVNPFDASVQNRLVLAVTNRTRTISGHDCIGYWFQVPNTNGPSTRGVAWLEKESGVPQEIENMTLDPLPDKRLKAVAITTRYETTTNGWHVKEIQTTGTVSALFIRADFHSIRTFSEYWKKPKEP